MRLLKHLLAVLGFLTFALSAQAQDNHFTLYNLLPLSLNPAQTAAMTGEFRAGALYRNQWRSIDKPFTTISAYADKKLFIKHFDLGVGLSVLNDRSGPGRLNMTKIYPSVSIQKRFGSHLLIAGIQPGLAHKKISDATFPAQYDHSIGDYNSGLPNGERNAGLGKAYFDLNAGFTYMYRTPNFDFSFGQAFHHVNMPNESLISNDKNKLPVRFSTHVSHAQKINAKLYVMPSVLFMNHAKAKEFDVNVHAGYRFVHEENLQLSGRLGVAYRNNIQSYTDNSFFQNSDAASVLAGLSWNKIDADFAYDINVSGLKEASANRGGFEIVLTYRNIFERKVDKITIPCHRY